MAAKKPARSKPSVVAELMAAGLSRAKGVVRMETATLEQHLEGLSEAALSSAIREVVLFAQLVRKKYEREEASQALLELAERTVTAREPPPKKKSKGWR